MFFADYSKGFHLIDHSILLRELTSFDIDTVLINWIRAFLTGRSQAVRIGNCLSDWKSPMQGRYPARDELGVILFAVMTNNLLRHKDEYLSWSRYSCISWSRYSWLGRISCIFMCFSIIFQTNSCGFFVCFPGEIALSSILRIKMIFFGCHSILREKNLS